MPEMVQKETDKYIKESDTIGRFIEESVEKSEENNISSAVLHDEYKKWCNIEGIPPIEKL